MKKYLKEILDKLNAINVLEKSLTSCVIDRSDINVRLLQLHRRSFVYILCDKSEIIYIGRTRDLYTRLTTHKMYRFFDEIILIEFNTEDVNKYEKILIKLFSPTYNVMYLNKIDLLKNFGEKKGSEANRSKALARKKQVFATAQLMRQKGLTLDMIAERLNELGYQTPAQLSVRSKFKSGGGWSKAMVSRLFKSYT